MVKLCSACGKKLTWNQSVTILRPGWFNPRLICRDCLDKISPKVSKEMKDG